MGNLVAVIVDGAIKCVTECNSLHPRPKTCYNKGICRLFSGSGPLCQCQHVDSTWYLGNDCSYPIVRTAFYIGLSVTFACLLVSVGALTAYLMISKRKQTLNKDIKNKQVNQWMAEDFEWSRANSATGTYNAGEFVNIRT
ncbi:mucin-12 [Etheostoma spectabile]|uniref:mucin-12 n=1 Tax=Etheostoma spectabile TaxID=54343 RepID=UPI0013AFC9B9|nr:mucin-12-like [Etheostoma spectabile]